MSIQPHINITGQANGGIEINGQSCRLSASVLPPAIDGIPEDALTFSSMIESQTEVGGISGTLRTEACIQKGVKIERELFFAENLCGIRLRVRNTAESSFLLRKLTPIWTEGEDSLTIAGGGLSSWSITRMSRHKNDVPGTYRPSVTDDRYEHAMVASAGFRAGMGVMFDEEGRHEDWPTGIDSEPLICIMNTDKGSASGLCIAVLGQTDHLSHISISANEAFDCLETAFVCAEFDGVSVESGEERATHWILFWEDEFSQNMLNRYAEMLAAQHNVKAPASPPPSVYCSWYFYGTDFSQEDLEENLLELKRRPVPIDALVIDAGWQNNFGDWETNRERFPEGMKHAADTIQDSGIIAGIWTCPFVVDMGSRIMKRFPDLVAKRRDGEPVSFRCGHDNCCVLDPTSPHAEEYFMETYSRLKEWGFLFHKFDYLRAVITTEDMVFSDKSMNRAQAHRHGLELIRKALGDGAYMLTCGGLFEGCIGISNGQRSGSDMRGRWQEPDGIMESCYTVRIKQNLFRNYHNAWWHTDPDALQLRIRKEPYREDGEFEHLSIGWFTDEEAFSITVNQYLGGGMVTLCERMVELDESRRALYRHVIPAGCATPARILDPGHPVCPTLFLSEVKPKATKLETWWTLAAGNWTDEEAEKDISLLEIPSEKQLAVFEFVTQKFLGLFSRADLVKLNIPAHGMRVFRIAPWDGQSPLLLGTDMHLSGGGTEFEELDIEMDKVFGVIDTAWDFPLQVTIGVPENAKLSTRTFMLAIGGNEEFNIAL